MPDSRRAILRALKRQASATIAQLAEILQLTGEAVRQQLLQLQRDGWIEARVDRAPERARTGRPATTYNLSAAGDHLFPKEYDLLNVSMIDAMSEELGIDAMKKVLGHLANEKVSAAKSRLQNMTLEQKITSLKSWYLEDDPYMDTEKQGGDFRLVERNCPFYNTAMRRPSLCSVSVNALTKLLGVRVRRDEKFQDGDGRCVFHVYANEPVDQSSWEFALESELS
ncbi:MAG: helix-turn-helix transcriptional regulator [Thermoanaerobaculia bacterium]